MVTKLDLTKYDASEHGNYAVCDTIGVPHSYCITPRHVSVAADQFGGMLDEAAIVRAEAQGAKCGICKGKLTYEQHETALLVKCHAALTTPGSGFAVPELQEYLKKLLPQCEADGYAGFAFVRAEDRQDSSDLKDSLKGV